MKSLPALGPLRANRSFVLAAAIGVLLSASVAHAADLNGHWRWPSSNGKSAIVHVDNNVTLGTDCHGTIDGSNIELTCTNPSYPGTYSLVLSEDEQTITGELHTIRCSLTYCQNVTIDIHMERCECFDGNSDSGDGCDLMCAVEECFECSGDPSTCTPLADATPCEDPSFCVSGGTCSAGTCEGGTATASCLDVTGTWLRAFRSEYGVSAAFRSAFVQEPDGSLAVFYLPSGSRARTGTIDSAASTIHMDEYGSFPDCGAGPLNGTIAPEGNHYTATGSHNATTPRFCLGFGFEELAIRCAPSSLEPVDGCQVDSCQRCEGDPVVCEPVPDWTPCLSEDPCTLLSRCRAGTCVEAFDSDAAECGGPDPCTTVPRDDCRSATTKLTIKNPSGGDNRSLRWGWKDGGPVETVELGRPDLYATVAICIYDESVASAPVLVSSEGVNRFELDQGWNVDARGNMRFRSSTHPISTVDLRAGDKARMGLKAGSAWTGPSTQELPLPLRVQLQIGEAGCFEGSFDAEDVRRNEDGIFKAQSAP